MEGMVLKFTPGIGIRLLVLVLVLVLVYGNAKQKVNIISNRLLASVHITPFKHVWAYVWLF